MQIFRPSAEVERTGGQPNVKLVMIQEPTFGLVSKNAGSLGQGCAMSVVVVVPCDHSFGWEAPVVHLWPGLLLVRRGLRRVFRVERARLGDKVRCSARLGFPDLLKVFPALATRDSDNKQLGRGHPTTSHK
jgi:hypothetical protein